MSKYYIGIDPGINGGLCCLDQSGNIRDLEVMPTMKIGTRNKIDPSGLSKWLKAWMTEEEIRNHCSQYVAKNYVRRHAQTDHQGHV